MAIEWSGCVRSCWFGSTEPASQPLRAQPQAFALAGR